MKQESITTTLKDGTERTGTIAIPETIGEAVKLLGEAQTYKYFRKAYRNDQIMRIRYNRKQREQTIKLKLGTLTIQQKELLRKAGVLKDEG